MKLNKRYSLLVIVMTLLITLVLGSTVARADRPDFDAQSVGYSWGGPYMSYDFTIWLADVGGETVNPSTVIVNVSPSGMVDNLHVSKAWGRTYITGTLYTYRYEDIYQTPTLWVSVYTNYSSYACGWVPEF